MTYTGTIRFEDDKGNVAFEHELNAEDIIYVLGKALKGRAESQDVAQTPAKRTYIKRKQDEVKAPKHSAGKLGAKSCCGSMGKRHFGHCKNANEAPEPPQKTDHGRLLTEDEFDTVKQMKGEDKNSMQIRNELGDDCKFQHINWAMLSVSYEAYVRHAESAK